MAANDLYIIGAGGHAKVVYDVAVSAGYRVKAFLDDAKAGLTICGVPIVAEPEITSLRGCSFAIALGNNATREKCYKLLRTKGYIMPAIAHASAIISPSAEIGDGTVIMPNCVVNAYATVGKGVILNTACVVEHDCVIGDFVHISPKAALAGSVMIGPRSQAGIGSSIIQNISIGSDCVIAAGAAVTKDLPDGVMAAGVPAVVKKVFNEQQ